jgi:sec-independent protein translocase protein TatA
MMASGCFRDHFDRETGLKNRPSHVGTTPRNSFDGILFYPIFVLTILNFNAMKATFLFLSGVGFQEILLIGLFVLVFFGAKKIPEFMKGLGKGVREFKDSVKDVKKEVEDATDAAKIEDTK